MNEKSRVFEGLIRSKEAARLLGISEWSLPKLSQKTAREISGHKTDSVFERYNIVSQADILDAARKIEAGKGSAGERQKKQKPIQSVS